MGKIDYQLSSLEHSIKISFNAMASPCEILLYTHDKVIADKLASMALNEVSRFEVKFSRYLTDNLCWQINHSEGQAIPIDVETKTLLDYAKSLFEISHGEFDISAGILARIWKFQNGAIPPTHQQVKALLKNIGFENIIYNDKSITLPAGMELDFGGIGKEYCVDRVAQILRGICEPKKISFLVNLGGDLSAFNFNSDHPPWVIGLEAVDKTSQLPAVIQLSQGAVATSGSSKRLFEYQGKRYAHILNAKTGYPIQGAPRSISVFAASCSLAGGLSTMAHIKGAQAEIFLKECDVKSICCW